MLFSITTNFIVSLINIVTLVKIVSLCYSPIILNMAKTDLEKSCPMSYTSALIGDTWTLLILRDILREPQRFNQLQESIPSISPSILNDRLKKLVSEGLVSRQVFAEEIPVRVVYTATSKGQDLKSIISAMQDFGKKYMVSK